MADEMRFSVFSLILPDLDFGEQVRLLKETGWDGIEVRVADLDPAKKSEPFSYWGNRRDGIGPSNIASLVPSMKTECDSTGIAVSALAPYTMANEPEKFAPLAQAAARLDCKLVRVMAPWYGKDAHFESLFSAARNGLKKIEASAREHRVKAALEIHMNGIAASPSGARRLVDGLNPDFIGVTLDPGNMVYEGFEQWRMACELLGPYLTHVHIKNAVWKKHTDIPPGPAVWQCEGAALREGYANWSEVMGALRAVGYRGWLSLEDFTSQPHREKLVSVLAFLKSL
jgi:sugar phosphate isomerase/epimerase